MKLRIILGSTLNGFIATVGIFFISMPFILFTTYWFGDGLSDALESVYNQLDIIIIIFVIGAILESLDRVRRGLKKSKVIPIIRAKEDRE